MELQSEKYLKKVKEEEVLQMEEKDKSLFVFSSFTSPAFLHCKKVCRLSESKIPGRIFRNERFVALCCAAWL